MCDDVGWVWRWRGVVSGLGASRVSAVSGNTAFSLSPNGNARPHQRLVLVAATDFDKDVMTRTLYGEAKHEDEPGQRVCLPLIIGMHV
jgi:hypothetical protein